MTTTGNNLIVPMSPPRSAVVAAAQRLPARRLALSTIVLECTNMPPCAAAVRAATGRTVLDITTLPRQRFQT